jgi:UPF0716 protein FxsA
MLPLVFIALFVVPIVELYVIVQIGQEIGVLNTIGLLIVVSAAGAWLLKQQGIAAWKRFQDALARGRPPAGEVADGALILFGGALLLTPGFVTDCVGLVLLIPVTRAAVKRWLGPLMWRWIRRRRSRAYSATTVRTRTGEWYQPRGRTSVPDREPGAGGDSRDTE